MADKLKAQNTTANELKFAYRVIQYMHGNVNNTYLILAIIAWIRSESGSKWRGWNPLNLRPGADDAKYRSGMRGTNGNGYFSVYKSLEAGARATANRLVRLGYYKDMIAAARGTRADYDVDGDGKVDKGSGDYRQSLDFLLALVVSKWDAGHYGLKGPELQDPNSIYKTTLYKVFQGLLGHKVVFPKDTIYTPPPPPPPPAPRQPRTLEHVVPKREYLQPYEARDFLTARVKPQPEGATVGNPTEYGA